MTISLGLELTGYGLDVKEGLVFLGGGAEGGRGLYWPIND